MPVMVDFWPRPPTRSQDDLLLKHLRPGDIQTHTYGRWFKVLLEDGSVNPLMYQAGNAVFIFDLGHGGGSFWFRIAAPAINKDSGRTPSARI